MTQNEEIGGLARDGGGCVGTRRDQRSKHFTTGLNNVLNTKSKIETTHVSFVFLKRRAVTSGSDAFVGTQQRFRLRVVILASSTAKRRDRDNHDE